MSEAYENADSPQFGVTEVYTEQRDYPHKPFDIFTL